MRLLERDAQLAQLTSGFDRALRGQGRLLLVHGEAGAGKTSVVQQFLNAVPTSTTTLVAGCEALFSPRPFGPLTDLADAFPPSVALALQSAVSTSTLFPSLLAHLRRPPAPKILVIEDLHCADEGTLDLVRYLGRRIDMLPVLFVVTYRDDDLGIDHPIRRLLGDLPATSTVRVPVPCLTRAAVMSLAQRVNRSGERLYDVTGGNPFFVTEVLNSPDSVVPPSVYDATLGRLARLGAAARALAELVAVSPKRLERTMASALIDHADALGDECVEAGLLRIDGAWLSYRHELARLAVEQSLLPGRAAQLHRDVYGALSAAVPAALARRVHHAVHGELEAAVLELAPKAARAAAAASSHKDAGMLFALATRHAQALPAAERAELLEAAAEEFRLVNNGDASVQATREALALRRQIGDALHEGMNLRRLAFLLWRERGERQEAVDAITGALAALERIPPTVERVRAYAELSRLQSAWSDYEDSVRTGERALALAAQFADRRCRVEALHASAASKMFVRDDREARAQLEVALGIAIEDGFDDAAAHLFVTLQMVSIIYRDHPYALEVAERGLAYCEARDLDAFYSRLLENRAFALIELARWDEANEAMARCRAVPGLGVRLGNSLAFLAARQQARRGLTASSAYWLQLQETPAVIPMGYRVPAIAAACAEVAWLRGDPTAARRVLQIGIEGAIAQNSSRLLGPLLVWAQRCGMPLPRHNLAIVPPHAHELAGDVAAAAAHWAELGCHYERALTLLHGNVEQMREALVVLDALGAKPAAEIARARLRAQGARGVQRGPLQRTRSDPLGLTARERQVYELLQQALSNAEIARQLHRSERTIESHVAGVLAKLGATSRVELVRSARESTA